jgi:hypothetical protein
MSDIIDNAQVAIDMIQDASIQAIRRKTGERELVPKGICHWCHDTFTTHQVFCDNDCAEDYRKYQRMR